MMFEEPLILKRNVFFWGLIFYFILAGAGFAQETEDIHDIRPPVHMPLSFLPWVVALGILILMAAMIFFVRLFLKRRQKAVSSPTLSIWQVARNRLDQLQAKNYPAKGLIKEYYSELSDILRKYIEACFALNAPDMTTEEFLESLKISSALRDGDKLKLTRFLTGCDLVKFAKYRATGNEMAESLALVREFVASTQPADGS